MDAASLSETLGYARSPHWLAGARLRDAASLDHSLARTIHACRHHGGDLWGVYTLSSGPKDQTGTRLVYVLDAPSTNAADEIHRKVWNQDVAPFLLMSLAGKVRLCTGFRYAAERRGVSDEQRGVLHAALTVDKIAAELDDLRAERIDDGTIIRRRGASLSGEGRIDVRLLENLHELRRQLLLDALPSRTAHALIGRFLYLRHLRDRQILDARRLEALGVDEAQAFGRQATARGFRRLVEAIDEWINGSVFPVPWTGSEAPHDRHVQAVASVFLGDDPQSGQMHLDFRAYDFSYIPVETLSIVYEQFLTRLDEDRTAKRPRSKKPSDDGPTRREAGAFYTPLLLVDFVLDELEDARPLTSSARVLDPACGSGAFLVQCYRRLVARWRRENPHAPLKASLLRDLLTEHIFGVDRDEDACRVTEFSLVLALLDHLQDEGTALPNGFKLPGLHQKNIFVGDFFDPNGAWRSALDEGFDWIVGNPPWVGMKDKGQEHARAWIEENKQERPVVDGRVAEAFAWAALDYMRPEGRVGFVLPAMTLFADREDFRRAFFSSSTIASITNLANLREVLFQRRARVPAAVFIYGGGAPGPHASLCVYSPLLLNQEAAGAPRPRRSPRLWTLAINASEVSVLTPRDIDEGQALPWKLAMWGSRRDARLLQRLGATCSATIGALEETRQWTAKIGVMLRRRGDAGAILVSELDGKSSLIESAVKGHARFFAPPPGAVEDLSKEEAYVRKRGGTGGVVASRGPHVLVNADFRFALFCSDFLVVRHPDVGIAAPPPDRDLVILLALYLNSRVARYHQFMIAPQEGVRSGRVTLSGLLQLPIPILDLSTQKKREWLELHEELVRSSKDLWARAANMAPALNLPEGSPSSEHQALLRTLDNLVAEALGLRIKDQWLIDDLLDVKLHLVDGLTRPQAAGAPSDHELRSYADALRITLDAFFEGAPGPRHRVTVLRDRSTACVEVEQIREEERDTVRVLQAEAPVARALRRVHARVRRDHPQWVYFDRNLVLYEPTAAYLFKPLQRYFWTRGRALLDADTLIAETLSAGGSA